MKQILITSLVLTLSVTLIPIFIHTNVNAWHENLGLDANKAAELYQTKPNDPAIVQWKNTLQSAFNGMDKCFDITTAISCQPLISTIISNCKSHPNELLACNDVRLAQYPLILNDAFEAQKKADEGAKRLQGALMKDVEKEHAGSITIERCITNPNAGANASCDSELRSLQKDCLMSISPSSYCNTQPFLAYFTEHNITNSTAIP